MRVRAFLNVTILVATFCSTASAQTVPDGKFGRGVRPGEKFPAAEINQIYSVLPITVECWAKLDPAGRKQFNVLISNEQKSSGTHWEILSYKDSGKFAAYLPSYNPQEVVGATDIVDGQWHFLAMTFDGKTCQLYVDGKKEADKPLNKHFMYPDRGYLTFGYVGGIDNVAAALIDEVRISKTIRELGAVPAAPFDADNDTIGLWHFDEGGGKTEYVDSSRTRNATTLRTRDELTGDRPIVRTKWQDMDVSPFLACTIVAPGNNTTYKGVNIRLGKDKKAAVCFDTELLRWSAAWTGAFLNFTPIREGLAGPPAIAGEVQFSTIQGPGWAKPGTEDFADPRKDKLGPLPKDWGMYRGFYVNGDHVVVAYRIGDREILESPEFELRGSPLELRKPDPQVGDYPNFIRTVEVGPGKDDLFLRVAEKSPAKGSLPPLGFELVNPPTGAAVESSGRWLGVKIPASDESHTFSLRIRRGPNGDISKEIPAPIPPSSLVKGGPANWPAPVITKGTLGKDDVPYTVDTLTAPDDNPWHSFLRFGGHDFFKNGDIAVCSVSGDVWRISGIDDKLDNLKWKRYAAGLFQPLGLKIVDDVVYVLGRDQITRLKDLNNDNEADFYECFNHDVKITTAGHSYQTCLETDPQGNFYFVKCGDNTEHGGTVMRVSKDGSELYVVATGVRNSNGMGASPDGIITEADNQGEWVPASRIDIVKQGGFLGFQPMSKRNPPPTDPGKPLVWMPQNVDNSSGGQCWVTSDKWGPFKNAMLHTSYGGAALLLVMPEQVNGIDQAGVWKFPMGFQSGIMRGRFSPTDGQLYVSGLKGWQTSGVRDGALQRVRYTGKPPRMPKELHVHDNGIVLTFTDAIDKELAKDLDSYGILQWNYKWSSDYGSRQWSLEHPEKQGYDEVKIKSARLLKDGKSVFLEVPGIKPVMQMQITYDLETTDGQQMRGDIYNTIHALGPVFDEGK